MIKSNALPELTKINLAKKIVLPVSHAQLVNSALLMDSHLILDLVHVKLDSFAIHTLIVILHLYLISMVTSDLVQQAIIAQKVLQHLRLVLLEHSQVRSIFILNTTFLDIT